MVSDFTFSLDFLAALFTFLYIGKLVLGERAPIAKSFSFSTWSTRQAFKRSLLNQQIERRLRA